MMGHAHVLTHAHALLLHRGQVTMTMNLKINFLVGQMLHLNQLCKALQQADLHAE